MFRKFYLTIIIFSFGFYIPQVVAEDSDSLYFFYGFEFYQHNSDFSYTNQYGDLSHPGFGINIGFVADKTHRITIAFQMEQDGYADRDDYSHQMDDPKPGETIVTSQSGYQSFFIPQRILISYDYMKQVGKTVSVFGGVSMGQTTYEFHESAERKTNTDIGTSSSSVYERRSKRFEVDAEDSVFTAAVQAGVELGVGNKWRTNFTLQYFFKQTNIHFSDTATVTTGLNNVYTEDKEQFKLKIDSMQEILMSLNFRRYF